MAHYNVSIRLEHWTGTAWKESTITQREYAEDASTALAKAAFDLGGTTKTNDTKVVSATAEFEGY